jgi:hypothetical protein
MIYQIWLFKFQKCLGQIWYQQICLSSWLDSFSFSSRFWGWGPHHISIRHVLCSLLVVATLRSGLEFSMLLSGLTPTISGWGFASSERMSRFTLLRSENSLVSLSRRQGFTISATVPKTLLVALTMELLLAQLMSQRSSGHLSLAARDTLLRISPP